MKDLILISAYCDTIDKENTLRTLVKQITKEREFFDLMVVSHTVIPDDISMNCNFAIYDKKNEILEDWNMRSTPWFNPNNERPILSCFTGFFNHHLAIWRMLIIGNSVAKNCGYNKVHHIEYDCYIEDFSELKDNSNKLDTFDAVIYNKKEETVSEILFGTYQAYRLDKLKDDLIVLDEEKIKNQILNSRDKSAEGMLLNILNHNNNIFVKNYQILNQNGNMFGLSHTDLSNKNTAWCLPFYDELTEKLSFIIWNMEMPENEIEVKIIYNNKQVIDFGKIKPKHWILRDIDDYKNAKTLLVLLNNKTRNFFEFDNYREEFKRVSSRKKENI